MSGNFSGPTGLRLHPAIFGFVGGFVDVCGYVALGGLFTAHITGNLAVLGAGIAHPLHAFVARLLVVPFFAAAVAGTRLLAHLIERDGRPALPALLVVEATLLAAFLAGSIAVAPAAHPDAPLAIAVAAMAVGAMGVQNASIRLATRRNLPTTAMTGNLTQLVLDAFDLIVAPTADGRARAAQAGGTLLGFLLGSAVGGLGLLAVGSYAVAVPIVLLLSLTVTPLSVHLPDSSGL